LEHVGGVEPGVTDSIVVCFFAGKLDVRLDGVETIFSQSKLWEVVERLLT